MKKRRLYTTETNPPLPPQAFDETPRLALVLTDETMYLTQFSARGEPTVSYPVMAEEVASAFTRFGASTGLLPPDILFWQSRGGRDRLALWLPPQMRALVFAQGRRDISLRVPMPGFVFVGEGVKYSIFAASERPLHAGDQLYHAPLPNVHPDGAICAGNVQFPKASADSMAQAAVLFFESHFNSDLSTDKIRSQVDADDDEDETIEDYNEEGDIVNMVVEHDEPRQAISLFQFLRGLEHARDFPADELVPALMVQQLLTGDSHEDS